MLPLGMAIVALGIIGIIWGIFQKLRAGRVADAPLVSTADAASRGLQVATPKGAVSVEGNVICPQPLMAPVSGVPCLAYRLKCTVTWKDGDVEKSKEIDNQKVSGSFTVDDGSGPVPIEDSATGDFEPMESKREKKSVGLIGGVTGTELKFGNYVVSTGIGSMGETYEIEEFYMPMVPRLYVCGRATNRGVINAPDWRQLLLSNKSRDELLGSAQKTAKIALGAGVGAFLVGGALATIGQLTADPAASSATSASSATGNGASGPSKKAPATTGTKVNKK
jgi:hypothetical protein